MMIDNQYQKFIDNFTRDLKYVILCMIDLTRTEEEKQQLKFENIINTLLEDSQKYFYINDNYLLKVDLSLDNNSYEINLSLNESYSQDKINDVQSKLSEIREFSSAKLRIYTLNGADFTLHYP